MILKLLGSISPLPSSWVSTCVMKGPSASTSTFSSQVKNLVNNNVLVLEFNKYGVLSKKEFYDKESMKKVNFAKAITENYVRKENFIYSFLSSIRQKMESKKK